MSEETPPIVTSPLPFAAAQLVERIFADLQGRSGLFELGMCDEEIQEEIHHDVGKIVLELLEVGANKESVNLRTALEEIKKAVGTSTEAWHIADKALKGTK